MTSDPLAAPGAQPLPADYDRHVPDREALRRAMRQLITAADWAALTWSELMEALLALGRTDVGLGRLVEGHLDAVRIADQAGAEVEPKSLYGVWASRSGSTGVRAEVAGEELILNGTLRFASGAGVVDRALVPVWVSDDHHLLVDLDTTGLPVDTSGWQTEAMMVSHTHTVAVHDHRVPRCRVRGGSDFYLDRPGFFPGGVGVAAVWAGGISRVLDTLLAWVGDRRTPVIDLRLGRIAVQRALAIAAVREGGRQLDTILAGTPSRDDLQHLSTLVRAGVGAAVHAVLDDARTVAGPVGLAFDAPLTHAIADLDLYVRQQNTDGDAAYLGGRLRDPGSVERG